MSRHTTHIFEVPATSSTSSTSQLSVKDVELSTVQNRFSDVPIISAYVLGKLDDKLVTTC